MFLVAGLAIAGLAGIAAAFYFSIRSGNRVDRRLRSAGASRAAAGRAGVGKRPGSGGGTTRSGRTDYGRRASARTAEPGMDRRFGDKLPPREDAWPGDAAPDDSWPGDSESTNPRQRRRVGFRKGTEVDEELWPTEAFGGVSDEQFWDDLASDKPLTTTARTAQQDPAARRRPLGAGPAADPQGRRGGGTGAYPGPRTAPNPATERTAIQPAYTATQPAPGRTQPVPSRTQPVPGRTSQYPGATQPVRVASGISQPMSAISQPMSATSQPQEAASQPGETRRRRPSSTDEDPLTSAAFSLRSSGPVDGRSSLRSRDTSRDQYDAAGAAGPATTGSHGGGSPYPYSTPSYSDPSSVTQTMNTPPYGENYGYGSRGPADETRRQNTRSHARPDGAGDGARATREAYAADAYQGAGGYQADGYQGTAGYPAGAYQGNAYRTGGYPGNGHRAPYDPRDDYRRLTPRRWPSAD